jgi:hypothetical protein
MTRARFVRRFARRCEDCGWFRLVRPIVFWVNGYTMNLCAQCEKTYTRGQYAEPKRLTHA